MPKTIHVMPVSTCQNFFYDTFKAAEQKIIILIIFWKNFMSTRHYKYYRLSDEWCRLTP